jgi:hypothetical protein
MIEQFTLGMDFEAYREDFKTMAAVERKLLLINEAALRRAMLVQHPLDRSRCNRGGASMLTTPREFTLREHLPYCSSIRFLPRRQMRPPVHQPLQFDKLVHIFVS